MKKGKIVKAVLLALFVILIVIQFVHPAPNLSGDETYSIAKRYPAPDSVVEVLKVACYDCHSNTTRYPWYAKIEPVAWWMNGHITDGKRALNFSSFTTMKVARQYKRMNDIKEQLEGGDMPLNSYLWIHKDAELTKAQSEAIIHWAMTVRESIKAHYPADSLVMPKKKA